MKTKNIPTPISQPIKSVSRHTMALLTFIALLPLVYFIPPWVAQEITTQHGWVTVISVAIIVPVISYLVIPSMLYLISRLSK